MKKFFKWVGIVIGALLVIILISAFIFYNISTSKVSKKFDVSPEKISIPTDPASIERGKHLVKIVCTDCHGEDLAGTDFFSDPALGEIHAANLTSGKGGAGQDFTDEDWVRAIRHGVDDEGRGLMIMPSSSFYNMNDADLGAVIAYLKSIPPVDKEWGKPNLTPMSKIMAGAGAFGNYLAVETIPHTAPRPISPPEGVTVEYGDYLVTLMDCRACHGSNLAGGQSSEPGSPLSPNLTSGGEMGTWSETDFVQTIRGGVTPTGKGLNKYMPWKTYALMTDDELFAVYKYIKSLPPVSN